MLSEGESDLEEPFEGTNTSSDEDYNPENEKSRKTNLNAGDFGDSEMSSASDGPEAEVTAQPGTSYGNIPQKGKKRIRKTQLWARNVRKGCRTKGKAYTNTAGVTIQKKVLGEICTCKLKCFENIGPEGCQKILDDFSDLSSKDIQDSYLYGLIKKKSITRHRLRSGEGFPKSASFAYVIRRGGMEQKICRQALLSLHSITKSRLERLQKHLIDNNGTPPKDLRGKHNNRPTRISEDTDTKIREHILSFPKYKSRYSRNKNLKHYYLYPEFSVAKMHKLYLQKHESEQYNLLNEGKDVDPLVKYEYFRKFFSENFKLSFGKHKSDTCQTCDKIMNKIDSAESDEQKSVANNNRDQERLELRCH